MRFSTRFALGLSFVGLASAAQGQKKILTPSDWNGWHSISNPVISADGQWVAYTLLQLAGDGELVVRSTKNAAEYRVPRGYLSRPNNVPGGLRNAASANPEGEPAGPTVSAAQFTADDKYALVLTQPSQAEYETLTGRGARAAGAGGANAAAANRTSLALVRLSDGQVTTIPNVRSFRVARESGAWLTYVPGDSAGADSSARGAAGAAAAGGRGRGGRGGGAGTSARRSFGNALVVRNMATGAEERIADVLTYALDDSAKVLGYTVVSRDSTKDGAFIRTLATGATATLLAGHGDYKQLAFDRSATQVAFLSDRDNFGATRPPYSLYYASLKTAGPAQAAVTASAVPSGMHIADNGAVSFTRSANAVIVNIAPPVIDSVPADSLVGKAVYDFWHYKDPTLQPAQKLTAARDRNRSFEAIYFPSMKKLVTLADDSVSSVNVSDDAHAGLATSRTRYAISSMWGDEGTDIYALDPATGARKLIREKISGQAQLSPDGKYISLFDRGHWYAYGITTGKLVDLTGAAKAVRFDQETHDSPDEPPAWGLAGWTKGDKSVLIYDRWDIWEADPTGAKAPSMVTDSLGRKQHLVLRIARSGGGRGGRGGGGGGASDQDRGIIDPAQPLLLSALNWDTKATGFYHDQMGSGKSPEKIVMAEAAFGTPVKAANADEYMLTKGTYVDFPNLYVGPTLDHLAKVSDANPQQKDFNWGTVELVHWTSADGFPLSGLLYKPENFDPTKKYPMVTYYYEQLSQGLHSYVAPNGRNSINITHYVSNGYLVFEPDIHYEIGYPGPSAVKSIVPGVEMLLARGYVDPKAMGLMGHSWGGYQTLYLITQSHMFAAAWAGAPVVDMFSAYGGIRWGSGLARAFQYEATQSRIGKSPWDGPQLYMENSPLFWLDRITTPLFILSDDADDAVPWYQGIELFVAMRRLGKEAYLIDYNNDLHSPASRANQIDAAQKMQQFFDTKLKGAPAPDWMIHGIPYVAKGRDQLNQGAPTPVQAGQTHPQPEKP